MPAPTPRVRSQPSCRSACWARSNAAPANGAKSPATDLTAGSSRTSCGAFIRTRRSSDVTRHSGSREAVIRNPYSLTLKAALKRRFCNFCDYGFRLSRYALGRNDEASALLSPQPHHHIDPRDLITLRRHRRLADQHVGCGDVHQIVLVFDEEVVVLGIVGVEIGF